MDEAVGGRLHRGQGDAQRDDRLGPPGTGDDHAMGRNPETALGGLAGPRQETAAVRTRRELGAGRSEVRADLAGRDPEGAGCPGGLGPVLDRGSWWRPGPRKEQSTGGVADDAGGRDHALERAG